MNIFHFTWRYRGSTQRDFDAWPFVAVVAMAGDYSIEVNKIPTFPEGIKTIAVLPISSLGGIDPIWLEHCMFDEMKAMKTINIIPAEKVKTCMFEFDLDRVDSNNMSTLASKLNVDAFLSLTVVAAGKEYSGSTGSTVATTVGAMTFAGSFETASVGLDMRILNPQSGKAVMKGMGYGETDWKDQKGVLSTVVKKLVWKTFNIVYVPKPKP